jgi:hypothetical protein
MHIPVYVVKTPFLTLFKSDMFQPSQGYQEGERLIYFSSKVNKMNYQILNSGNQQNIFTSKVVIMMIRI